MEYILKIHQIFSLVEVNFDKVLDSKSSESRRLGSLLEHYRDIAFQLQTNQGLNYTQYSGNAERRLFENAKNCYTLIEHMHKQSLDVTKPQRFNGAQSMNQYGIHLKGDIRD